MRTEVDYWGISRRGIGQARIIYYFFLRAFSLTLRLGKWRKRRGQGDRVATLFDPRVKEAKRALFPIAFLFVFFSQARSICSNLRSLHMALPLPYPSLHLRS